MISLQAEFKVIDRGFSKAMVLIPGWASDHRIFNTLDLGYNYILPLYCNPGDLQDKLYGFLKNASIEGVSIFGWSQGAFLAADFASKYPEVVSELVLSSIRRSYDPLALGEIKDKLKKNKRAYLYRFYRDCFSQTDQSAYLWFKDNLLNTYLDDLSLDELLNGLDYLANARVNPDVLERIPKVRIFHGTEDKIAPFAEVSDMQLELKGAECIYLQDVGHIPFLHPHFKERFNG